MTSPVDVVDVDSTCGIIIVFVSSHFQILLRAEGKLLESAVIEFGDNFYRLLTSFRRWFEFWFIEILR